MKLRPADGSEIDAVSGEDFAIGKNFIGSVNAERKRSLIPFPSKVIQKRGINFNTSGRRLVKTDDAGAVIVSVLRTPGNSKIL
jgi:hypothetical protein